MYEAGCISQWRDVVITKIKKLSQGVNTENVFA